MSRLNITPVQVLEHEVKFLIDFIKIIENRTNIDPNASQEKLDGIKVQCQEKIKEFEEAITKLK